MYAKGCYWCWWASSLLGTISSVEVGDKSRSSCCKAWLPESYWQGFHSISPAHPVDHLDRWLAGLNISLVVKWLSAVIHIILSAFYSLGAQANQGTYLRSFLSRFLIILRVNSWSLFIKEKVMVSISGEAQQRLQSFSHWGYTSDTCDTWYTCDRCESQNK